MTFMKDFYAMVTFCAEGNGGVGGWVDYGKALTAVR